MQDTFLHQGMRRKMVEELSSKISDPKVLEAMMKVPRHLFLDPTLEAHAYTDMPLPILCDQTISQPSTVAFQTQLLELQRGMRVLEIGTGSGYQTAILCTLGAKVWTIERQKVLYDKTKPLLAALRYRAHCYLGDGYKGLTETDYLFDRILITCGAPYLPQPLADQLKPGGILVIPVGNQEQEMLRYHKDENGVMQAPETCGNFRFVPMLSGRQF